MIAIKKRRGDEKVEYTIHDPLTVAALVGDGCRFRFRISLPDGLTAVIDDMPMFDDGGSLYNECHADGPCPANDASACTPCAERGR